MNFQPATYSMSPMPIFEPKDQTEEVIDKNTVRLDAMISTVNSYTNRLTPIQKERIAQITGAVVAILAGIAAVAAAVAIGIGTLGVGFYIFIPIGIVAAVAGVSLGIFASRSREDLNSPKQRTEILNKVAQLRFRDIAAKYSTANLMEYALLDGCIPQTAPETRKKNYAMIPTLTAELNLLNSWHSSEIQKIETCWAQNTAGIRSAYDQQMANIEMRINNLEHSTRNGHYTAHALRSRSRALNTVFEMGAIVNGMGNDWSISALRNQQTQIIFNYHMQMNPYDQIKLGHIGVLNTQYQNSVGAIEAAFASLKT